MTEILDIALHRRHAALWLECERLEAELKKKTAELAALGDVIGDNMVSLGVLSLPFQAESKGWTHYLHTSFSVRRRAEITQEEGIDALRRGGLDWIVKPSYAASTLSSWAREELANERALPSPVADAFYVHSEHELRLRGSTKKRSVSAKAADFYRGQARRAIEAKKEGLKP